MAHILNKRIISEGTQKAVVHFYFESDGVSTEWLYEPLIDPVADMNVRMVPETNTDTGYVKIPRLKVLQMWYLLGPGVTLTIGWDGIPVSNQIVLVGGIDSYFDCRYYGGIRDMTVTDQDVSHQATPTIVGGNVSPTKLLQGQAAQTPLATVQGMADNQPTQPLKSLVNPLTNATMNNIYEVPGSGKMVISTSGLQSQLGYQGSTSALPINGFLVFEFGKYLA